MSAQPLTTTSIATDSVPLVMPILVGSKYVVHTSFGEHVAGLIIFPSMSVGGKKTLVTGIPDPEKERGGRQEEHKRYSSSYQGYLLVLLKYIVVSVGIPEQFERVVYVID